MAFSIKRKSLLLLLPPIVLALSIWGLVWLGIQAGDINHIGRTHGLFAFFNSLRAALPLIAGALAVMVIGYKLFTKSGRPLIFFGPLGLAAVYGLIGLISASMSPDWTKSVYWAAVYLSVPLAIWAIVLGTGQLERIAGLFKLNALLIILATVALFITALAFLNLDSIFTSSSGIFDCELDERWFIFSDGLIRKTAVGRYSAIAAIISLVAIATSKPRWQAGWLAILILSMVLLATTGARTAFAGFAVGATAVVLLSGNFRTIVSAAAVVAIAVIAIFLSGNASTVFNECLGGGALVKAESMRTALPQAQEGETQTTKTEKHIPAMPTARATAAEPLEIGTPEQTVSDQPGSSVGRESTTQILQVGVQETPSLGKDATDDSIEQSPRDQSPVFNDAVDRPSEATAPDGEPQTTDSAKPTISTPPSSTVAQEPVNQRPRNGNQGITSTEINATDDSVAHASTDQAPVTNDGRDPSLAVTAADEKPRKTDLAEQKISERPSSAVAQESADQNLQPEGQETQSPQIDVTDDSVAKALWKSGIGMKYFTTGRTDTWSQGWSLFKDSPMLGFGFHADRLLLGTHMHNSYLHAMLQTGIAGTIPFVAAILWSWVQLLRLLHHSRRRGSPEKVPILLCAGLLAFFTVRTFPESTGAFFGVDWLLLAPLMFYIQQLTTSELETRPLDVPNGN